MFIRLILVPLLVFAALLFHHPALALTPDEVVVIANRNSAEGLALARYYMDRRSIPAGNLCLIDLPADETCDRTTYDEKIRKPVFDFLRKRTAGPQVRCLVTTFGLPLKISALEADEKEASTTRAAVDSELALVLAGSYPLKGWQPNPYFLGFQHIKTNIAKNSVLMVSRLDGPDISTVYRIINDSLAAEQKGLRGTCCLDARWPKTAKTEAGDGYQEYDNALHRTAVLLSKYPQLQVRLNHQPRLFAPGECDKTALYCGWYSLGKYVDSFSWQQGAVGYHIASAECASLKKPGATYWCKRMLEKGVAATIGPVYEPFVQGFPRPDIFFPHLADGYLSLAECYLISQPYLSWQMVLIGDPLYMPFPEFSDQEKPLDKNRKTP